MSLRLLIIIGFLFIANQSPGQAGTNRLQGTVSFITTSNAYVKFENTEEIKSGDTLQLFKDSTFRNCLVVTNKSSVSVVCFIIGNCNLMVGDVIIHPLLMQKNKTGETGKKIPSKPEMTPRVMSREQTDSVKYLPRIYGRLSASSYSFLSEERGNSHRTMYQFSLNASHIKNTRFSFESDVNYRQYYPGTENNSLSDTRFINIYSLALKYDSPSGLTIFLGRKINPKASSTGATDGLQIEKYFGNFFGGLLAGFRPDIYDQEFNPSLLQYGAYIGHRSINSKLNSLTALGVLEQMNDGVIDRRYAYFQHSSTIGSKLNLFSSFETDFYQKVNDVESNNVSLTNLYASAGYRVSKIFNISLSYDTRRKILYYETFRTDIERMLEDDEARKGARIRVHIRPVKNTSTGISYAKRFQSSGQNPSDNINAFFTLNKIPWIQGLLSVNYNLNVSSYLESRILSFRHSRYFFKNVLYLDIYYRIIQYSYKNNKFNDALNTRYEQNFIGTSLNLAITKKLHFSILGELSNLASAKTYRINTKIIKRL